MEDDTPIDAAFELFAEDPDDLSKRVAFLGQVLRSELYLLTNGPAAKSVKPQLFEIEGAPFAIAFDTAERLSAFAGEAHFSNLSGRNLLDLLATENLGCVLNPEVAPSSYVIDPETVSWLAAQSQLAPVIDATMPVAISAPIVSAPQILQHLDRGLAALEGAAAYAYLIQVEGASKTSDLSLAFIDVQPGREDSLASYIQELVAFSGQDGLEISVLFLDGTSEMAAAAKRQGLRFEIPKPARAIDVSGPGMDPSKPPKVR